MPDKEKEIKIDLDKLLHSFHKFHNKSAEDTKIEAPEYIGSIDKHLNRLKDKKVNMALFRFTFTLVDIKEDHDAELSYKLLRNYKELCLILDEKLSPHVQRRFNKILKKDVEYIRMQEAKNGVGEIMDIADSVRMLADQQQPMLGNLTEQEQIINYYLHKILDFRLATLPEEEAWDFIAQSILEEA